MNVPTTTVFRSAVPRRSRRVLLACANAVERDRLERRLERGGYVVESTETLAGCREILGGTQVDLLVVAADLPDAMGVQVVRRLRSDQRLRALPLMWLAGTAPTSQGVQALEADADEVLHGAVDPEDLLARLGRWSRRMAEDLRQAGERAYVLAGDLTVFAFPDLVAFLHGQRRSGILAIVTTQGFGTVFFREGEVIDASYGNLGDVDAFDALFRDGHGHFEFRPENADALPQAAITCSTTALLLDAARRMDHARAADPTVVSAVSPMVVARPPAVTASRLPPEAWQAMAEACAMELSMAEFRPLSQRAFRTDPAATAADARVARWVLIAAGPETLAVTAGLAPTVATTDVIPLVGGLVVGGATTVGVGHPLVESIEMLHVPLERIAVLGRQIPVHPDAVIVMPEHGDMLTMPIEARISLGETLARIGSGVVAGVGNASVAQGLRHLLDFVGWRGVHLHLNHGDLPVADPRTWMAELCARTAQNVADVAPMPQGPVHVTI